MAAKNDARSLCVFDKPIVVTAPSRSLSNPLFRLTGAFIEKIDPQMDMKYQLLWNYGDYLADVPCRLGKSAALDAAADALVMAHARFCTGHLDPDAALLRRHSRALRALREDLHDPIKAHSTETLCSIMLHMIYQVCTRQCAPQLCSHLVADVDEIGSAVFEQPF